MSFAPVDCFPVVGSSFSFSFYDGYDVRFGC